MTQKDEKTGRFTSTKPVETETVEDQIAAAEAKLEELKRVKAEQEMLAKQKASLERKAEASKVEEAFKELNAAKKEYNDVVDAAQKAYVEKIADAKKVYNECIAHVTEKLDAAEVHYNAELTEFQKAHPEGFYLTLKDGDNVKTISRSSVNNQSFSFIDDFFNFILNH